MWQLFAEQTNIYKNQFFAANPNLKPRSRSRSWVDTNPNGNENPNWTSQGHQRRSLPGDV